MTGELGVRIRQARLARGWSLRSTAARAEISPSLLSQVETGKVQPSVSTLYAIVNCLDLSVDDVLGYRPSAPRRNGPLDPVQRGGDAPELVMENGVTWRRLAVMDGADRIDALRVTYLPGASSSIDDAHMRHAGVEHGYLISGELTLKIDFETFVIRAGDSLCFDSQRPHLYLNQGEAVAEGVWFVTGRTSDTAAENDGTVRSAVDALEMLGRAASPREVESTGGAR